ncbi:glucosaminidase domain-containing protein [Listeria aquatica]|uniref:glucosaminidase domain-containing protein n=1 Tax=Listeria aquatica TaxID=1494960 RepID=UPI003EF2853A
MKKILIISLLTCFLAFSSILSLQPVLAEETQIATLKPNSELGPGYYSTTEARETRAATNTSAFLASIKQGSISGWKKYKILPSITSAQAILESGWGKSELATRAHNLFGVKGYYNGQYVVMPTLEYQNGKWITVQAKFRKYPNKNVSIEDHGAFLQKSRYKNIVNVKDYQLVANRLKQDGYATDPQYANKLISLIKQYQLDAWDKEAFNAEQSSTSIKASVVDGAPLLHSTNFNDKTPLRMWRTGTKIQVRKYSSYWYKTSVQVNGKWMSGYIYHSMVVGLKPVKGTDKFSGTVKAFSIWWDSPRLNGGNLFTYNPKTSLRHYPSKNGLKSAYYPNRKKVFYTPDYWLK